MEERNVNAWEDFENQLQDLRRERDASSDSPNSSLLFRGQEDSCWLLKTTLDRKRERMLFSSPWCKCGFVSRKFSRMHRVCS